MLPFFQEEQKRKINLGGASYVASSSTILDQARLRRTERLEQKKRQDSAVKVQAWWRGNKESREVRKELKEAFGKDVSGIMGLRCLVLLGREEEALGMWSKALVDAGQDEVFRLGAGEQANSWLTLIRKVAVYLLESVALNPLSPYSLNHLTILQTILSPDAAVRALGPPGREAVTNILSYAFNRGYYSFISQAIQAIPLETKKTTPSSSQHATQLPLLISLSTQPFTTYLKSSPEYAQALSLFFAHILTITLLPNRIPIAQLPAFVSTIPFSDLHLLSHHAIFGGSVEQNVNLVANCTMFFSPHYNAFPPKTIAAYLRLLSAVFNELPAGVFEPPRKASQKGAKAKGTALQQYEPAWRKREYEDSEEEEDGRVQVSVVHEFTSANPPAPLPNLDTKTYNRLQKLVSLPHLESLVSIARRSQGVQEALIPFVLDLNAVWPTKREHVLTTILAITDGHLIRSVYRSEVRMSPLGKEGRAGALFDPQSAPHWLPLLFLAELYNQALLTMGDDEFFGSADASSSSTSSTSAIRNPLTIDELVAFSRQLLNIAYTLFLEDQALMKKVVVTGSGSGSGNSRYTLEVVREKVTKCLVAIHARDSRKPFVPPDGWLVMSQIDMMSFIEAAILEEQQISDPNAHTSARMLNRRNIASLSPRLGVLNNIPFAIPFEVRVSIFRNFILNDMMKNGVRDRRGGFMSMGYESRYHVHVRRGRVAQDGFDRLGEVDLKHPIKITFIDQFGQEEAGIDGGGVFKEFFTDLCKEVFDTDRGLWLANKKNELYPNPHSYATEPHSLNWYRFIGRVLGKAMYEGILVDVAFAGFFLAKWLGKQSYLDDLSSLDPDLYKGLIFLKHYKGNPEDLALNFTIAVEELGETKNVDLIPNGSNISVTHENRLEYITLVSHYRLTRQIKKQSDAFFEGLSQMIDPRWLRMFNQQEIQVLIGGVNSPIDLDDLRRNTNYGGLYDDHHPVVEAFWKIVNGFDQEQRRALLRFATSCSRPPLLGFKELVPNFSIRDAGPDVLRLPTSSTCVNLLKLPPYPNERIMREKILQAINSNSGFDLS